MEDAWDVAMEKIRDVLRTAGLLVYFSKRDLERFPKRWMKRGCPDLESPEVRKLLARIVEMEEGMVQQLEVQRCQYEDKLFVLKGQISRLMLEILDREQQVSKQKSETEVIRGLLIGVELKLRRYENRGFWQRGKDLWCYITQRLLGILR